MDMATMDTMARGLLKPSLDMVIMVMDMVLDMVMDMAMDILATDMVVMDTMDIMARGPLMLSPAMDITVMDMVMDMAMDMDMVTMDTMARDQLSQDMDIMAMDMDMDMVMDMAMVMDTMVKQICCSFLEFSTNEVGLYRSSQKTHNFHLMEINIEKRKKK